MRNGEIVIEWRKEDWRKIVKGLERRWGEDLEIVIEIMNEVEEIIGGEEKKRGGEKGRWEMIGEFGKKEIEEFSGEERNGEEDCGGVG